MMLNITGNVLSMAVAGGTAIEWCNGGDMTTAWTAEALHRCCPFCSKRSLVALPPYLADKYNDGTTYVCHPLLGGCNQGFGTPAND